MLTVLNKYFPNGIGLWGDTKSYKITRFPMKEYITTLQSVKYESTIRELRSKLFITNILMGILTALLILSYVY